MSERDDKLHCTLDIETGLLSAQCYVIVRPTEAEAGAMTTPRYHGFGGEGTVTVYANKERLEEVLSTLNPEQGWMKQRVLMVTRIKVETKAEAEKE